MKNVSYNRSSLTPLTCFEMVALKLIVQLSERRSVEQDELMTGL